MSERPDGPSPYVSIYLPRRQAEEIIRALEQRAEGRASSSLAGQALRNVRKAVAERG